MARYESCVLVRSNSRWIVGTAFPQQIRSRYRTAAIEQSHAATPSRACVGRSESGGGMMERGWRVGRELVLEYPRALPWAMLSQPCRLESHAHRSPSDCDSIAQCNALGTR